MDRIPSGTDTPQRAGRSEIRPRSHDLEQTRTGLTQHLCREPSQAEVIIAHRKKARSGR